MKNKKQALFQSIVSLVLCISMLVGTTFAWFTDAVVTGINTIASGVLDVELYHSNAKVTDEPVDSATKLFMDLQGDPILWEPGVVSYENLTITNAGDLALAYQLAIATANENFVVEESGAQYGLSQILKVGVVEGGITATDRAGVVASVADGDWTTLSSFVRSGSLLPEGAEEGESEAVWGVVIYWEPGANDNYWNLNNGKTLSSGEVLSIDLGVTLIATQVQYENDAFGSDYDAAAKVDVFPVFVAPGSTTTTVVPNEQNQVAADLEMTAGQVSASIPAGVQLAEGTTELTMSVTEMEESGANISLGVNEAMRSLDVHIEGVDSSNTVPMEIVIREAAPKGLNAGNLQLYHVENGVSVEMTLVGSADAFTAHNQFKYDPATGDIILYMATFSEVAMIADTTKAWEGKFDYTWYDADATELTIANADQLAGFGAIVGGMAKDIKQDDFDGDIVKLIADINLNDVEGDGKIFYPIGYYNSTGSYVKSSDGSVSSSVSSFEGTFDGQGHTIANFYQNTWEMFGDYNDGYPAGSNHYKDAMGLFGYVYGGTVKNLTVSNFSSDGEFTPTGVIAAYADGNSTFENIAITNCNPRVYNTGNGGIIGIAGDTSTANDDHITLKNITVDNSNKISALWGSYDVACGGLVGMYRGNVDGSGNATGDTISFENCHVAAQMDVYNDVCGNYQYYAYRYAGMIIGSVRHNTTNGEGKTIPNMTGISATGCTVNYGDWNDYYYCEFVKNGHPSYSGPDDYKFSRVPHSELYFTDSNGNCVVDADERASVTGCTHAHNDAEDKKAVYLPFHQLFTGYGWGVSSVGLEKYSGVVTNLDITEGEQEESVKKFVVVPAMGQTVISSDKLSISVGDLFAAIEGIKPAINGSAVQVAVSAVGDSEITADYVANTSDWKQGTLTFNKIDGLCTVTIQDYNFCKPTTFVLKNGKLHDIEKFAVVFPNVDKYTYRVGNMNPVALGSLFKETGEATVTDSKVEISVTGHNATYVANSSDWTQGTLDFSGYTGLVTVTISEEGNFEKELNLQVVDAVNATSATNATANNVVLLNDCGFSSLEVSGGYSLYGNGFTMTCGSDSASLTFGEFVKLDSGTLDNVQIVCPNYDFAALYNSQLIGSGNRSQTTDKPRYYNAKSAVTATGNSQILNSRISGGRAALYASNGNIVVDNSRLEGGAVATVMISAANSFVFRDATLIQKPTVSTYDKNKTLMGMSVLYLCDTSGNATPTTLEGSFVQNAWADSSCTEYMPDGTSTIATTVLGKTGYTHTINGKTCVNLGFAYMPNEGTTVNLPNNITDERTHKNTIPYSYEQVSASVPVSGLNVSVSTYVYTYGNRQGTNNGFTGDSEYMPDEYSDIVSVAYSDTADGLTSGKSYGTDGWVYELNVDLDKLSGYALDFSKLSMSVNGVAVTDFKVDGNAKPTSPVAVTAGGVEYTLTATIDGKNYTASVKVTGTETSKESPSKISGPTAPGFGVAKSYGSDWSGAADVLTGVKIKYWSVAENKYVEFDFSNFTVPGNAGKLNGTNNYWEYTHSNNDFTLKVTNTVAIHSGKSVYGMPILGTDGKLYFTISSTNGYVGSGTTSRSITMQYEFTDNNGGEKLTFTHTFNISYNKDGQYSYNDFCNGTKTLLENEGCVTPDTLVTLADGSQKRIDEVSYEDQLLVWNFVNGEYVAVPSIVVRNHGFGNYRVLTLNFSDGSKVNVIAEHGFFDVALNEFVMIDEFNVANYVGHDFVQSAGNGCNTVTLDSYSVAEEYTAAYSILTAVHYNCILGDMLTLTPNVIGGNYFMPFEVGQDMRFDAEKMQSDIDYYGLFTYEEFAAFVTEEQFYALNAPQVKVAVGKGIITMEQLYQIIEELIPKD